VFFYHLVSRFFNTEVGFFLPMTTVSGCVEDQQIIMGTVTANDIE